MKAKTLLKKLDNKAKRRGIDFIIITADDNMVYSSSYAKKRQDLTIALATYIVSMKPKQQEKLQAALGWVDALTFLNE